MNASDFWSGLALKLVQLVAMAAFAWYFAYQPGTTLGWCILILFAIVFAFKFAKVVGAIIGFYMIRSEQKRRAHANGRIGNDRRISQR